MSAPVLSSVLSYFYFYFTDDSIFKNFLSYENFKIYGSCYCLFSFASKKGKKIGVSDRPIP